MAFYLLFLAASISDPVVHIPGMGSVQGVTRRVQVPGQGQQVNVEEFLGIPYASPPVGRLRWQPPQRAGGWNGTRNAAVWGATCMGSDCEGAPEHEDCLYLNVFRSADAPNDKPLPVLVFIHGGGYTVGCSNLYSGGRLAARKTAVVVTLNYRLGVFGFLGAEELRDANRSTGNFGLQDQRAALLWVQEFISAFGGSPGNVMVFGESAGAGSVGIHLVAPASRGLFHTAAAESGLGAVWSAKPLQEAQQVFHKVARNAGCSTSPVPCLRSLSAHDLLHAASSLPFLTLSTYLAWSPVVDGQELTQHPWRLFRDGAFASGVPVLSGVNRDEYAYFFYTGKEGLPAQASQGDFNKTVKGFLPSGPHWLEELTELYQRDAYEYPHNLHNYSFWWWAAMRAVSDHEFTCPNRRTLQAVSRHAPALPLYSYFFVHPTQTPTNCPGSGPGAFVVPHTSDMNYVFDCPFYPPACLSFPTQNAGEEVLVGDWTGWWLSFSAGRGSMQRPWTQYTAASDNYLSIDIPEPSGAGYTTVQHIRSRQCDFWDRVLEALDP